MKKSTLPPGPALFQIAVLYLKSKGDPVTFMTLLAEKYGDIVRFKFRSHPDYLLAHPDQIKKVLLASEDFMARSTPPAMKRVLGNGLLTSQGQFHRMERRFLQPAFHRQQIDRMTAVMSRCIETHILPWKLGQIVNIGEEMKNLTLEIILQTLFGVNLTHEKKEVCEAIDIIQDTKNKNAIPILDNWLGKLPLQRNQRLKKALGFLDRIIYRLIDERRRQPAEQADFLALLLDLQESETGKDVFTDQQIRDEALTMLAAGHETISNAMTWAWYLLSQNPHVAAKLHQECASVLNGRTPGLTDLENLRYTRMVYQETMRLYPPVWIVGRRPVVDFNLGEHTLSKGSFIHISPYLVHHNSRFHENPEVFQPERWEKTPQSGERSFSYFPFGGGARLCIGEGFAWAEGILIIAAIAQRFGLTLKPEYPVKKDFAITLRPRHRILMTLEEQSLKEEEKCPENSKIKSS